MVKTLVTGGTGFIGSAVVRRLVRASESVRVMSRQPERIPRFKRSPGTEFVQGNVFDAASLELAMEGCDCLINAVQFDNAPFENPRKGQTYERIDGEGTERQIEAAKKAGVKRIIYLSGAGTREGRTEPWFKAKLRAEKAVQESGATWTIFRPSWIYGPGDRSLNKFASFARIPLNPIVPVIGSGKEKIQPVFVQDVAEAIFRSLQKHVAYEKIYELGGPEVLTMNEIVKTMLRVMKKKRLILPHPKPVMKFIASFVQWLPDPLRFLTPRGIDFITMEEKVDSSALVEALGIHLTKLDDGLRQYLAPEAKVPLLEPDFRTV